MTTTTTRPIAPNPSCTVHGTRTGGLRRRYFSRLWQIMDAPVDEQIAIAKDEVFRDVGGAVVEVGAGHGSNFVRYPTGTKVLAFEPNSYMKTRLAEAASSADIELDHRMEDLREARLESDSVPTVVSVLTLCSVADPAGLITEIHRVLQPGGQFIFVEHIAEASKTRRLRAQRIVRPLWSALFDGCDPAAPTDELIAGCGFSDIHARTENLGPSLDLTNRTHWGVATK
ncbi:MAG: class I SAM-dependent methyltransferase [Acidimicrobiales bacterium]